MQSLSEWLSSIGLQQYSKAFSDNDIDIDVLPSLSDQELERLGVSMGHRKRLLKAVVELGSQSKVTGPAQAAERRQLTVLFCDLVGSTQLASRLDPESLHQIVRLYEDACAACVTRYEGYVFQRLGDGIVAFFGYPLAHEGEAERAIHAGLSIIDALSSLEVPEAGRLQVRIGIATGLVVVSSMEKGAVGETMNIASRLQGIAPIGSVVVSEKVHRLAAGRFEYEDLGLQSLKGIDNPSRAFRVKGVSAITSRFGITNQRGPSVMVGREEQFSTLIDCWNRARDGRGQVVMLSGEPGIGKSRLLHALKVHVERGPCTTLFFQCSPYHTNSAFHPSIDHLTRGLKLSRSDTNDQKLDKVENLVVTNYGRPLADVRYIAEMLSIPSDARYGKIDMSPLRFKEETLRALVELTEAVIRQNPTLLLFEDVHWADPTSLEMLDLSINRIGTVPILIILTGRPEFKFRWGDAPHTREICLERLTKAEGQSIINAIAQPAVVPDQILDQILDKADGIPLFVEELTKTMLETGVSDNPQLPDEHWEPIVEMSVPETLKDSLTARLDRLPEAREVAQFGSVIGREFSLELISSIVPKSKATLDFALHRLLDSGIILKRGSGEDAVFTFTHALIQEAAYESLLKSRRAYLHNQIATVLEGDFRELVESEPEILAHHYTEAGAVSRAIPSWVSAGGRAVCRGALQEALGHYQRGLALVDDLPRQSDRVAMELKIREHLTTTCIAMFGWAAPPVGANASAIVRLAKNHESSRSLLVGQYGMWLNCLAQGRIAESLDLTRESRTTALASEDCKLSQLAENRMTMVSNFYLGRLERAQEIGDRGLALCESQLATGGEAQLIGHDMKTGVGMFAAHWTWMMGYPDQAVRIAEETNAYARKLGQNFNLAFALIFSSQVYFYRCESDRLLERCKDADELAREQSMLFVRQILVPAIEGLVRLRQGRFAEAIDLLTLSIDRRIKRGQHFLLPHYRSALAEAQARNGNLEGGLQLIEECLQQIERPGWEERVWLPEVRRLKGWMLLQQGRVQPAEEEFVASIDCARRQHARSWELRSSISLARLWNTLGKRKQAHELLAPLYGWFTEGFDSKDLKDAKRLLGQDEQDIAVNA